MEFEAFPKVPRLNRGVVVTEKIDGTNACIVIEPVDAGTPMDERETARVKLELTADGSELPVELAFFCQSRKRIITPGKNTDNAGFATWVAEHAEELATLAPGRHFGEWWGKGIQRGYEQEEKRFSLFNVHRWHDADANGLGEAAVPECCSVVPVVYLGQFIEQPWNNALWALSNNGSYAAPGYMNPEGVMVYHSHARSLFKVTLDGDEAKSGTTPGMHSA